MMSSKPFGGHFDRFDLLEHEGSGFMGTVYRAHDPLRGETVALKLIPLNHADQEALRQEKKGAVLQQELSRMEKRVAKVHEYGEADGQFYVVMEYVAGRDLALVLAREEGPLALERAVWIAYQLCQVLVIAHGFTTEIDGKTTTAILHGDLKPENLRLQQGDRVRILDFGLAKSLSQSKVTRNVHGTTLYLAPERLQSQLVNEQSDLWAVGIILYQMVAGYPPYAGSSNAEVEKDILSGPPRPLPPDCPGDMKRILQHCLSVDPDRRYATASALKDDLEAFQAGRPPAAAAGSSQAPEDAQKTRRVRTVSSSPPQTSPPELSPPEEPLPADPPSLGASPPPAPAPTGSSGSSSPRNFFSRHRAKLLFIVGLLLLFGLASQVYVRHAAADIVQQVNTQTTPDLDLVWNRYQRARRLTLLGVGLGEATAKLRTAVKAAAERILSSYRQDQPTPRQGDWRRARSYLQMAIELGDDSALTRAKLLYADAHVDRIDAASLHSQGETDSANRKRNDATFDFRRSAELAPEWPDPFLGLARIHAYDHFNLEALKRALEEAEARGYAWKDRERAQLADAHLTEGKRLYARARELEEGARRRGLLDQALYHLDLAGRGYQGILGFGRARQNREEALRLIDRIQKDEGSPG